MSQTWIEATWGMIPQTPSLVIISAFKQTIFGKHPLGCHHGKRGQRTRCGRLPCIIWPGRGYGCRVDWFKAHLEVQNPKRVFLQHPPSKLLERVLLTNDFGSYDHLIVMCCDRQPTRSQTQTWPSPAHLFLMLPLVCADCQRLKPWR